MSLLMPPRQTLSDADYSPSQWPTSGTGTHTFLNLWFAPQFAPVLQELSSFLRLDANWNSYGANRISHVAVESAIRLIGNYDHGLPTPDVYPTSIGGVMFEWGRGDESVEMRFEPNGSISILVDNRGEMTETSAGSLYDPEVLEALKWAEKFS